MKLNYYLILLDYICLVHSQKMHRNKVISSETTAKGTSLAELAGKVGGASTGNELPLLVIIHIILKYTFRGFILALSLRFNRLNGALLSGGRFRRGVSLGWHICQRVTQVS